MEPREGETCTLSFGVNQTPSGMYASPLTKWFKDGHQIDESNTNKYWFIEHGNERSLTIQNCAPEDAGNYKAFIVDESSESPMSLVTTNSCRVIVQKLKVDFITPLERFVSANRDETVKIYCETVQENLKPKWYHNEILIETGSSEAKNKEFFSTNTQHLLIINDIQEKDSGLYTLKFGSGQDFITEVFYSFFIYRIYIFFNSLFLILISTI